MIVIRMTRFGRLNSPFYRIVVATKRSKREAKPIEVLGTYNPSSKQLTLNKELMASWVKKGAQISTGVAKLLKQ